MTFTDEVTGPDRVPETITVTAANGVRFLARILREGDRYGLDDVLTWEHADRPGVEFFDTRYTHTRFGQFVSRYYVETILESTPLHGPPSGLNLHGGVEDWTIDGQTMWLVRQWLHVETGLIGA